MYCLRNKEIWIIFSKQFSLIQEIINWIQGILDLFLQTFSLHWKFTVSESRNFGFFFVSTFLSSKKRLIGFKEFWIFCGTFSLIIGNLQFQNQGILEFFFCKLSLIIGTLLFQNQGILDFFLQTFSHHWNFTVSESRNFGFFLSQLFSHPRKD